jgi:hypothetical protein
MMGERFSERHNLRGAQPEITIREDAPEGLRAAIPLIAEDAGMRPNEMRRVACQILLVRPDPSNWSEYPNVWEEVNGLLANADWFKVYDIAEAFYGALHARWEGHGTFQSRLNHYFEDHGIGWQMTDGLILYRGSETFREATREAASVLKETGRINAANEIHEALRDISRRPQPDVTGAIQHVIAALECIARDITGEPNHTLGRMIPKLGLAAPLDTAVEKLWGYASDRARHIREGQKVDTEDAELVVSVACAVSSFLAKKNTIPVR